MSCKKTALTTPSGSPHPTEPSGRTALVLPLESDRFAGPAHAKVLGSSTASRSRNWLRRLHTALGVVSALNLLLLITTGFLLQHRETLGLEERMVSRGVLPQKYRPQDGAEGVRADIVAADLHSGRLFGRIGALVLDGITLGWLALLASGLVMYSLGRWRKENGSTLNGGNSPTGSGKVV